MREIIMKFKFILFILVGCLVAYELYYLFTDYGKVYLYHVIATILCAYHANEVWLKD